MPHCSTTAVVYFGTSQLGHFRKTFRPLGVVNARLTDRTGSESFKKKLARIDLILASPECSTSNSIVRGNRKRDESSRRSGWYIMRMIDELLSKVDRSRERAADVTFAWVRTPDGSHCSSRITSRSRHSMRPISALPKTAAQRSLLETSGRPAAIVKPRKSALKPERSRTRPGGAVRGYACL